MTRACNARGWEERKRERERERESRVLLRIRHNLGEDAPPKMPLSLSVHIYTEAHSLLQTKFKTFQQATGREDIQVYSITLL